MVMVPRVMPLADPKNPVGVDVGVGADSTVSYRGAASSSRAVALSDDCVGP